MKSLIASCGAVVLALGGLLLVGCSSTPMSPVATSSQNNAYAGGNGAFGEDPVNPGEYSRDRFNNAVAASAQAPAQNR